MDTIEEQKCVPLLLETLNLCKTATVTIFSFAEKYLVVIFCLKFMYFMAVSSIEVHGNLWQIIHF